MDTVELSETLLAKLAGWEAMKSARSMLTSGRVLSSSWHANELRGVVQQGSSSIKSGLIIRSGSDADNLCPCRESRERGMICAHAIAVGLHVLKPPVASSALPEAAIAPSAKVLARTAKRLMRAADSGVLNALEVSLILPPNLPEAAAKGKIMLYCEGKSSKGTAPLNSLPLDVPFSVSQSDSLVLDELEKLNDGDTPAMLMLDGAKLASLLETLVDFPRISIGRNQKVRVLDEPLPVGITARLQEKGGIALKLNQSFSGFLIGIEQLWLFENAVFRRLSLPQSLAGLLRAPMTIPRAEVPQFLNSAWPSLVAGCELDADFSLEDFEFSPASPVFKLYLLGGLAALEAKLECFYGGTRINAAAPASASGLWIENSASPHHFQTRNLPAEAEAVETLRRSGFVGPDTKGSHHLKGQEKVLKFFATEFPRLEKVWQVTLEARLEQSTQKNLERIEPQLRVSASGEEWFDLSVAYSTAGGERFSQADIQNLLRSGQSHKRLANGKFALLDTESVDEFSEILVDCQPDQRDGAFRIKSSHSGFVQSTAAGNVDWKLDAPESWRARVAAQTGRVALPVPALGVLDAVLRPYQKHGVAWLAFLRASGFGGILADEMGLGKTIQVLAFLNSIKNGNAESKPSLVICPTSLVVNWAAEAAKFTPSLRVLVLHGADRKDNFGTLGNFDLVITSYALIRRDLEFHRALQYENIILDEAQHIKNRASQNAQSVKALRSRNRLVLTGTPIENSVLDLWSIFDFLMSGYLGTAADFKERYELPLTRDRNPVVQDRLHRRLRPFILRRLKKEVAADLPDKIEQISYCELSQDQRVLYNQVLDASRREILAKAGTAPNGSSRMLMLTALLRLRQICCDPRLLKIEEQPVHTAEGADVNNPVQAAVVSGKFELFTELLEEVMDGGHRALVFSQFTSMLGLLKQHLDAEKIPCCYLDGSTKDRAAVVEKFQRGSQIPVFLISLKAGGTGLNLTGADTVIHFDPWWNPAVEAQATDRAHRIGQKRVVTSYKLITRGTVEEKILNLQRRKKTLLQGVMGEEEGFVNALNWSEIQELLAD